MLAILVGSGKLLYICRELKYEKVHPKVLKSRFSFGSFREFFFFQAASGCAIVRRAMVHTKCRGASGIGAD